ncbi:MAG: conjugal transfer protein TraF [Sulfuricaulis sp.]
MRAPILLFIPILLSCLVAQADEQLAPSSAPGNYAQHDQGWFFYKDPKDAPEKKPPPRPAPKPKSSADSEVVGSVAWIRDHINQIRDRAIDNPTKDNLELFAYVQKMMMDKSEIFATKFVQTSSANPALDEGIENPVSSVAKQTQYAEIDEGFDKLMRKLSKQVAIWYFFRSDCPYCAKENPILNVYLGHYGFSVLPISTDGKPLADGSFPNWVPDHGQAEYLKVTATPTMYLVHPPKDVILLSVGLKAGKELATRIIDIAHTHKWISDADYDNSVKGLPRRYLTQAFDPSKIDNPDDPQELLKAFRASGVFSTQSTTLQALSGQGAEATPISPAANP